MYINPIAIVAVAAVYAFGIWFCVRKKPLLPLLSGLSLIILACFVYGNFLLNAIISSNPPGYAALPDNFAGRYLAFLIGDSKATNAFLESESALFSAIVIAMIVVSLVCTTIDIKRIFFSHHKNAEDKNIDNTQ